MFIINLIKKDFKNLYHNLYGLLQSLFMGMLMIFLLSLGIENLEKLKLEIGSLIFWIASFFCLSVLFRDLYKFDTLRIREELCVSKVDFFSIFLSKAIIGIAVLLLLQIVFLGAIVLFLNLTPKGNFTYFMFLIFLIDIGLVALSALFSAVYGDFSSESLLMLIIFPLQIPLLLGGIKITAFYLKGYGYIGDWIKLVISCDAIFIGMSLILFPYIYYP